MDSAQRGVAFIAAHQFLDLHTGGGLARRGLLDLLLTDFDFIDVLSVRDGSIELTRVTSERRSPPQTIRKLRLVRARRVLSVPFALARRRPLSTCLLPSMPQSVVPEPYEMVVVDTVRMWKNRTAVVANGTVLSLDDLLSCRYASAATIEEPELVFSSSQRLPGALTRPVRAVLRRILTREARLLSTYELDAANLADVAVVVSEREARILRDRGCTSPTHATGIPASTSAQTVEPETGPERVVLLGDFRYFDNVIALGQMHDALQRVARPGPTIQVIGTVPAWLRARYQHRRLEYLGFVTALDEVIGFGTVSVVAGANIGGLKTKAIESMMLGSAVWAVSGQLDPAHFPTGGAGITIFANPTELVEALSSPAFAPAELRSAGRTARRHALEHFSTDGFADTNRHLLTSDLQ